MPKEYIINDVGSPFTAGDIYMSYIRPRASVSNLCYPPYSPFAGHGIGVSALKCELDNLDVNSSASFTTKTGAPINIRRIS